MTSTGLYVLSRGRVGTAPAEHGLTELRAACERLVIVVEDAESKDAMDRFQPDEVLVEAGVETSYLAGLRAGLLSAISSSTAPPGPIIATGGHVLAPIGPVSAVLDQLANSQSDLFAPYWHNVEIDPRVKTRKPSRVPYLDFAVFGPALLASDTVRTFWQDFNGSDFWSDFERGLAPFARLLERHGHDIFYPFAPDQLQTTDPRLYEVHRLVAQGCPCLPLEIFSLDPLLHDLNAIALRPALDMLRENHPAAYRAAMRHASRTVPLREFNANADQFEVLPEQAVRPDKTQWSFGIVAVFIHAYYPEMIEELAGLAANIPAPHHLFVTTASEENRQIIEEHLLASGYASDAVDVRVVEQNRGRDMSSLFITFRDVILSGRYEVALRLHSKRTPQVSPRVAEEFKMHLFENLVANRGYVSNLLDKIEAEPDIGLLMPPIIHIGFGTLGHSWFNNYTGVRQLADKMGFDVPLDRSTPVAPNGTMYWFRTDALRRMFEWPWNWEDYNKEPHHIDGGQAHVQERLIGYCAQTAGYRIVSVMTPKSAARNYAKLEYKLQRLMSHLNSGNIFEQDQILANSHTGFRGKLFRLGFEAYGRILRRWPASRRWLRPLAHAVRRLLAPVPRS